MQTLEYFTVYPLGTSNNTYSYTTLCLKCWNFPLVIIALFFTLSKALSVLMTNRWILSSPPPPTCARPNLSSQTLTYLGLNTNTGTISPHFSLNPSQNFKKTHFISKFLKRSLPSPNF